LSNCSYFTVSPQSNLAATHVWVGASVRVRPETLFKTPIPNVALFVLVSFPKRKREREKEREGERDRERRREREREKNREA
jgi:hypothetical protein